MAAEPVKVASFKQNRLIIDAQGFGAILDKAGQRPLAIVSINGPMRSGKSYMLNNFLRYLNAKNGEEWFSKPLRNKFHWKNSDERQTTGILVWSEPFVVKRNDREIAVLLMDTQGCFDDKTTTHENSLIFALSCLFSSTLIYNIKNQIQEDILQFLQMFVGFAKMGQQSEEPFSKLIFLIRDWQSPKSFNYGYHDNNNTSGHRNYKMEKLNTNQSMAPEVRIVRNEILSSFLDVGCCLMPYPGNGLACEDDENNLDGMFAATTKDFIERLFDPMNLVIKNIGGHELSGPYLKQMVEQWAKYFASAELPEVKNVTEATAEVQNQIAFTIGHKFYRTEMDKLKTTTEDLSDAEFQQKHQHNSNEAIAIFKRMKRLRHREVEERFLKCLQEAIEQERQFYEHINTMKRNWNSLKKTSEQEKNELREEMNQKLKEIETQRSNGGFGGGGFGVPGGLPVGSSLESGISKVFGLVLASTTAGVGGLVDGVLTGDFKKSFEESRVVGRKIMKNFGWNLD